MSAVLVPTAVPAVMFVSVAVAVVAGGDDGAGLLAHGLHHLDAFAVGRDDLDHLLDDRLLHRVHQDVRMVLAAKCVCYSTLFDVLNRTTYL